jgi:methylmalonyl-CoA mutase N-terminal domain/subunit
MTGPSEREEIAQARRRWEETTAKRGLERLGRDQPPARLYTPLDLPEGSYEERLGFPGEFPFTRGTYAYPLSSSPYALEGAEAVGPRAGFYAGYGTAEDTRDLWRAEGRRGVNLAFDLPTQCGYDSDHPMAAGEVGRTGVAIDTLADFETLYEAFDGVARLDEIASNYTINAPCNLVLAMYFALAEKKGVALSRLRGTPQNDILKEFVSRGTYIFPPGPSMRMVRDTITFCCAHAPSLNVVSVCGYHIREAGATDAQACGFAFAHAIAYARLGLDAGLAADEFLPAFTFNDIGGGMDFWREIARARACRRVWARIARDRLGARNPRSMLLRGGDRVLVGPSSYTSQRPLNNLVRGVLGGVASFLATGTGNGGVPWDEVFGLGHSYEARQLSIDAGRILRYEAKLGSVIDPLGGSYFVEALTDQVESEIWQVIDAVEARGGAVAAIECGYTQGEVAHSAYEAQRRIETGEDVVVGVNRFTDAAEIEVLPPRHHPYDSARLRTAAERQLVRLRRVKADRSDDAVRRSLDAVQRAAASEEENLIPHFIEAVKAYATIGEVCDALRRVFGEAKVGSGL